MSRNSLLLFVIAAAVLSCDSRAFTVPLLMSVPTGLVPASSPAIVLRCWDLVEGRPVPLELRLSFSTSTVAVVANRLWATADMDDMYREVYYCSSYADEERYYPSLGRTEWRPFFSTSVSFQESPGNFNLSPIQYVTAVAGHPELGAQAVDWTGEIPNQPMPADHGR